MIVYKVREHSVPEVVPCIFEYKPYFFLEDKSSLYDTNLSIPSSINNIINMDSICLPEYYVSCDFHTYKDMTLDVSYNFPALSTNGAAFVVSSMSDVNLLYNSVKKQFLYDI